MADLRAIDALREFREIIHLTSRGVTVFHLLNRHIVFMEAHCCVYKVTGKLSKNLRKTKKDQNSSGLWQGKIHSYALCYTANTVLFFKISALLLKVPLKVDCKIVHVPVW